MAPAEKPSYPKTLWSATPGKRTRILIPDPKERRNILRSLRFREGHITVNDEHEEAIVRRVMQGKVWDQDLTEPKINQQSGWVCYSSEAYTTYVEAKLAQAAPAR